MSMSTPCRISTSPKRFFDRLDGHAGHACNLRICFARCVLSRATSNLYDNLMTMSIGPVPARVAPVSRRRPAGRRERLSDRLAALLCGADRGRRAAPRRPPAHRAAARRRARRLAHRRARGGAPAQVARPAACRARARACSSPRRAANQPLAFDPTVLESVDAVVHVVEVRRVLEGEIAALAAQRATRAQIAGLQARAGRDRRGRGRGPRRRRRRPGLPPRHRRGHRQPAVQPPARLPRAVPARGACASRAATRRAGATSWSRCATSTARSSTRSRARDAAAARRCATAAHPARRAPARAGRRDRAHSVRRRSTAVRQMSAAARCSASSAWARWATARRVSAHEARRGDLGPGHAPRRRARASPPPAGSSPSRWPTSAARCDVVQVLVVNAAQTEAVLFGDGTARRAWTRCCAAARW